MQLLEREGDAWEVLTIPQTWDEKRRFTTSLGWTDPRHEDGALAFPARFPQHIVEAERVLVTLHKRSHNPYLVASRLADRPIPMPWFGNKQLFIRFA